MVLPSKLSSVFDILRSFVPSNLKPRDPLESILRDGLVIHASTTTMKGIEVWPRSFYVIRMVDFEIVESKFFPNRGGIDGIVDLMKYIRHLPSANLILWRSSNSFGIEYWFELLKHHQSKCAAIENLQFNLKEIIEQQSPKTCSCKLGLFKILEVNGALLPQVIAGEDEPLFDQERVDESTAAKVHGMVELMLKIRNKSFVVEESCLRHSA